MKLFAPILGLLAVGACASGSDPQSAEQLTRAQYDAALSESAGRVTADMKHSHECFVRSAFYSQTFKSGQGEATDRVTRRLYDTTADIFRGRINALLDQGASVPDAYAWVGPAFFEQKPEAQRQAADWFRQDSAAAGFDSRARACYDEAAASAGAVNMVMFRRRALMTTEPQ